jgi:hypothetical protein
MCLQPTAAAAAAAAVQVISAEANYVRVNISHLDTSAAAAAEDSSPQTSSSSSSSPSSSSQEEEAEQLLHSRLASYAQASSSSSSSNLQPPRTELLCTVRALLKKISQRVLVGDRVRVHGIDWLGGRGVVDSVQPRSSELADPAIANVGHVLLLFGLTQPPVSVTASTSCAATPLWRWLLAHCSLQVTAFVLLCHCAAVTSSALKELHLVACLYRLCHLFCQLCLHFCA